MFRIGVFEMKKDGKVVKRFRTGIFKMINGDNNLNSTMTDHSKTETRQVRVLRKCLMPVFFAVSFFYMEFMLAFNMEVPMTGIGMFNSFLFSIFYSLVIFLILILIPSRVRKFAGGAILLFVTIIFCSQLIYYKIFKTFFSIYSAAKGSQVLDFIKDIFYTIGVNSLWLAVFAAPFVLYLVFFRKMNDGRKYNASMKLTVLLMVLVSFGLSLLSINLYDRDQNSPYDMYYKNSNPLISVLDFGLMTTMRLDVKRTVFGFDPVIDLPADDTSVSSSDGNSSTSDYLNNSSRSDASSSSIASSSSVNSSTDGLTPTTGPTPSISDKYNVMNIDFKSLISKEKDATLQSMHKYFSSLTPSAKNDYTGIYKGYNLILITAEGFSQYAVDPILTPTLYKMSHEGYYFPNFYTPLWGVSTSDGEYVATTGLIPKSGVWSMFKSADNYMPFAMGNQLKSLSYKAMAYHNHRYNYYGRDLSHPNLGYTYKGLGNGLDVKPTWPESDLEMMQKSVDEYIGNTPFHTYYMTVSGHLRYSFGGNFIASKNRSLVDKLSLSSACKAYLATQIELDRALSYLMQKLEAAGIAEKTLFVISADHYPYGLKKTEIDELAGHEVEGNFELMRNSLILYVKGMKPQVIDAPASSLDVIPTISNLLGTKFDSRLLMGRDLFSDTDPLVIFSNKSFITDKGRYNSVTKKFEPLAGESVDANYRQKISNMIDKKFYYSAKILDTDYYKKVFK
jgi:lipoteichoic acid synthase